MNFTEIDGKIEWSVPYMQSENVLYCKSDMNYCTEMSCNKMNCTEMKCTEMNCTEINNF